jgi:hypothetical protein
MRSPDGNGSSTGERRKGALLFLRGGPRRGSRSDSISDSASWIRSPPRHSTTISARSLSPVPVRGGLAHHGDDLIDRRRIRGRHAPLVPLGNTGVVARHRGG